MKFNKGLFTDGDPIDQPANTYRDAQNMLLNKRKGAISSEEGNTLRDSITADYTIIGDSIVYDDRHVLFLAGKPGTGAEGESEIGVFDAGTYTTVVNESALNFDPDSVLEAVTLINNKDQVVVYWTDNINPPRFLNIDEALDTAGFTIEDIEDLRIFSTIDKAPVISLNSVQEGGNLLTGAYYFGIRYLAEDDSTTGYMQFTPPVYINDESVVGTPDDYDGAPSGSQTSKAIVLDIENLDQAFDRYQLAVIRKENDTIAEVRELEERTIAGESSVLQYNGGSQGIESSFDQVVINTASYNRARTIAEADNTLYMGNLSQSSVLDYQKYANNIKISAVQKPVDRGGSGIFNTDHYGNPIVSFYDKSFKRGEVYAFYISFVLSNGVESEAFHIPGRSTDPIEEDGDGEPLPVQGGSKFESIDPNGFEYQFKSNPGTNNMAYWENRTETYPSQQDDEAGRWEIWDVDSNGDGQATGNTLHGENVRHHHFPDVIHDDSYAPFNGTEAVVDPNQARTLGIELSDIKIPANIIDQIRGIKIYYAKRNTENKRILDQGFAFSLEAQEVDSNFFDIDETVWMFEPPDGGQQTSRAAMIDAFHSLRTRQNIGTASYVKLIQTFTGDFNDEKPGDDSEEIYINQMENFTARPLGTAFHKIKDGTAITYVEKGGLQEATNRGFSFDIFNGEAEQGIAVEFDEDVDFGNFPFSSSAVDSSVGVLAEICTIRDDLFAPFDLQELIWTGRVITDISLFDPRGASTTASPATGEIDVQTGSNDIPDTQASCETVITAGTDGDGGQINVTYDGNTANINVAGGLSIDNLGTFLAQEINSAGIGLTASYASGSDTLTFTADDGEEGENGKTVTIDPLASGATFDDLAPVMAGGLSLDDLSVTLDTEVITVDTPNDATAETVASAINTAINAQSTNYSSTVNGTVISITSNVNDIQYNGVILLDAGNTGVTITDTDLTGGSDGTAEGLYTIEDVYGGDTFIVRHGTRRTGFDVDGETLDRPIRYLIEYVTESSDNIKLRHEGQGDGEIYYPKSSALDVLTVEDDFGAQINIQNYIGYNPDYSAQAEIKSATPGGKRQENILNFPTRIIRSVQGDTNIGEDEGLRTFLENDFIDLTRKRGELVHLAVVNNIIIPHMQRALIRTKGREEVVVGDIRAFMGAGDIFAVEPDEIISTNDGFAGLQDPKSAIVTPHGYFFVDRRAGKIFLLSDSPKPISDLGLHNFFYDELTSEANDNQFIACYDNKWDRIILTRKGEWTVSYYPQYEMWGSFHTYNPEYYLYNVQTFFSLSNDGLYEHNDPSKSAEFYGSNAPSYLEFVDNRSPMRTKYLVNIEYVSEVEDPATGEKFYKETFDQFRVNNNYQDSGDEDIIYFTGAGGNARHVEGTWKINKFRNMLDPDTGLIDINKPWQEQERFIGKYAQVKLTFNNSDNKFVYLYDAKTNMRVSVR